MSKRVVIAAGGTGGHLFPAQSLAADLTSRMPYQIFFIAKGLATNARFNSALYPYKDIASGPINFKLKTLIFSPWSILKGIYQSVQALKTVKADVVIGFGSYHSFPVLCAARLLNIPIILHEANSVPGKVNRIFSPYAAWTGVFFPEASKHLKGNVQITDIPLRAQFTAANRPSRADSLKFYGLSVDAATVLVFGGSLGAKKLNDLACKSITMKSPKTKLQVLHFTGGQESSEAVRQEYSKANVTAVVREFENQMQYAWAAADVAVARSGASTIAEAVAFGVPSIFIPYPYATDAHQDKNAEYIATSLGGGVWFHESTLDAATLAQTLERFLLPPEQSKMKAALAKASQEMQGSHFSDLVISHLEKK